MVLIEDLEVIYAEIKHHLDGVLPDESIDAIIKMLKEHPEQKALIDEIKQLGNICDISNMGLPCTYFNLVQYTISRHEVNP